LEGVEEDAIAKICRELTLLLESAHEKQARDACSLESTISGAASRMLNVQNAGGQNLPIQKIDDAVQEPRYVGKDIAMGS